MLAVAFRPVDVVLATDELADELLAIKVIAAAVLTAAVLTAAVLTAAVLVVAVLVTVILVDESLDAQVPATLLLAPQFLIFTAVLVLKPIGSKQQETKLIKREASTIATSFRSQT